MQTSQTTTQDTAGPARQSHARARSVLRAVTVAACLPYLTLKVSWISGGTTGIPEGSALRAAGGTLTLLNAVTLALDCCVVVLAFALTRPWGRRLPSWLLALPLWCATGLLGPILVAFPPQQLYGLLAGDGGTGATGDSQGVAAGSLLQEWVWGTVYAGFTVQGLALGALFVLYARERWGPLLRGRVGGPACSPDGRAGTGRDGTRRDGAELRAARIVAACAVPLALLPAVMHGLWASGADTGLNTARIVSRNADTHIVEGGYLLFALCAVAGVLIPAFRRAAHLPLWVPFGLAWAGSGVLACWGGCLLIPGVWSGDAAGGGAPTALMTLTYAVQMLVGALIAAHGARLLTRRAAAGRRTPAGQA